MPIKQSELIKLAKSYDSVKPLFESMEKRASSNQMDKAFLCHSHIDSELVKGIAKLFLQYDIDIYIDWLDNSMPSVTNRITAEKIQKRINESKYFFFLCTEKSMKSRWCPWEIGYADKGNRKILIIPTKSGDTTYGNEYLQLYPRIDEGQVEGVFKDYVVFDPNSNNNAKWLTETALKEL